MRLSVLGLFLTYRCTSFCRMCCVNAGPSRNEIMRVEDALSYVREAASLGVRTISLTGGEPFLCYENMLEICRYASEFGLEVTVLTNCSWAISENMAIGKLEKLKELGLGKIMISADDFHQEFVPLERVKFCFNASLEVGLETELRSIVAKNTGRLEYFAGEVGAIAAKDVSLTEFPVVPAGRGVGLDPEVLFYPPIESPCPFVLRMMAIEPDGNLAACCGVGGFSPPLIVGNVKNHGLKKLVAVAEKNLLYSCLSFYGPQTLLSIIKDKGYRLNVACKHVDRCHVCFDLLSNAENQCAVAEALKQIESELSVAKMLSEIVDELPPPENHEKDR